MKKQISMWIALMFVAVSLSYLMGQSRLSMMTGGLLTSCAVSSAKELAFCNVAGDPTNPDGLYVSANGAAFFLVGKAIPGGVQTFNSRTGNVLPATGDYSYGQLSGKPTAISCSTSAQSNTGLTANGCTFN
jgi:hypothetical protein